MKVSTFVVGAFEENCYLVVDEESRRSVLIDPGDEGDRLVEAVRQSGTTLDAIWLTHAHLDHIGGVAAVLRASRVPVFLHPADEPVFHIAPESARYFGVDFELPPYPDRELAEGVALTLGTLRFDVMHTPGHAPGHVTIHGHGAIFSGDCLFAGSIGRTDLPYCDGSELEASLARIATLTPESTVYPGHGPSTTLAHEQRTNPFLTGLARPLTRPVTRSSTR